MNIAVSRELLIPVSMSGLARQATHEASHAVVALALDLPIAWVSLAAMMPTASPASFGTRAIILLAGGAGERRRYGNAEYDATDRRQCRELLVECFRDVVVTNMDTEIRNIDALAAEAVNDDWPWIERTADALMRKRVLDGADVARLRPHPFEGLAA